MNKQKLIIACAAIIFSLSFFVKKTEGQSWNLAGNAGTTTSQFIGTTDSKSLRFKTNNATRMVVNSNGNVGIGITAPSYKLHISGAEEGISIQGLSNTATNVAYMTFRNSASKRIGYVGDGSTWDNNITISADSGDVVLNTYSGRVLTATYSGNVGIGTTSPAYKFVVSNGGAAGLEFNASGGLNGGGFIQAYNRSTSTFFNMDYYASAHNFIVNSPNVAMTIAATSGNVGIGNASPLSPLDITGSPANGYPVLNVNNSGNGSNQYGIRAECSLGINNVAIKGAALGSGTYNYGVHGWVTGATSVASYAVYGQVSFPTATPSYAGYFAGNVNVSGTFTNVSDRQFKKNIHPI